MLQPELLECLGPPLLWSLLRARWTTLSLDNTAITANQRLEEDQTANQLLERIGPQYQTQPITYLASLCGLYRCVVYFSLSGFPFLLFCRLLCWPRSGQNLITAQFQLAL